jgi:hypothetical protein
MENNMKLFRYLLPLAVAVGFASATTFAAEEQDTSRFQEELNERDFDALRDFLTTKRTIDVAEKSCNLAISGDVRTEWRHLNERCRRERLRGRHAHDRFGLPISRNDFDIEFNLRFDYVCDRAWGVAHLQFDNSAGVDDNGHPCCRVEDRRERRKERRKEGEEERHCHHHKHKKEHHRGELKEDKEARRRHHRERHNCCRLEEVRNRHEGHRCCPDRDCYEDPEGYHGSGRCNDICLKKAYMGYNVCCEGCTRFDVEIGRRNLYNVFDSQIQFLSRFDGILLRYSSSWECFADWYLNLAGFVVDERVNHFAWVTELAFINIFDAGFDFKYSFIDWRKNGRNRCWEHNPRGFRFENSQFLLAYNVNPEMLCTPATIYGAFLWNHGARRFRHFDHEGNRRTHHKRKNIGWYVGFTIGEVVQECDWAFDFQYQVVEAQAVPDEDVSGIGRGNVLDESFTSCARRGNTNYKGWRLEGLYALTDNLTLDSILEWSRAQDNTIGGRHHYSKFEIEAIYAF